MALSGATAGIGTLLRIGDGGGAAGVQASVEWGSAAAKIRIKWKQAGTPGNGKNITVVVSGSTYVYTTLSASAISITVPTTATVAQVIANLYQQAAFNAYWDADFGATPGDGSGTITARTVTPTAGGSYGAEVFTVVSEVRSITGPERSQNLIEVTHMESPDFYREYLPSLLDAGNLTFMINYTGAASQEQLITDLEARTRRNFQLEFVVTAGTKIASFAAFIVNFGHSFEIEDAIVANTTLKITGSVTVT